MCILKPDMGYPWRGDSYIKSDIPAPREGAVNCCKIGPFGKVDAKIVGGSKTGAKLNQFW